MDAHEGRAWLDLLLEYAPRLRAEGVYKLTLGPVVAELALTVLDGAPEPTRRPQDTDEPEEPIEAPADPLDDGTTYGTQRAPGYEALRGT